jgi:hypothetical protein
MPIATPTSARFKRRGVVHPVTGHRYHLPVILERLHQAQLVFRRGPGEDVHFHRHPAQSGIVHHGYFGAGDGRLAHANGQLRPDGARRFRVVAGDHLDPDAGMVALADGAHRFFARRVDDADQGQQHIARLHIRKVQAFALRCAPFAGQGKQAQPLGRRIGGHAPPVIDIERPFAIVAQLRTAHVEDALRGALDENPRLIVAVAVISGHETVLGLEGNGVEPGPRSFAECAG